MDAQVGRLRTMLRAKGIADNTMITYTAGARFSWVVLDAVLCPNAIACLFALVGQDNGPEGQSIHGYHGHV